MAWISGQKLQNGKYTIEKELGVGGFGITYRARDNIGRKVVIKTLNDTVQRRADFAKFQQDFLNEALRLARCSHSHIVRIDEVIQEGALWCMVMEYIDGEDLASCVENRGALSETEALRYIQQIGEALTVVHNNGLLHRDIKPNNIMIRSGKSEAVLIDFGIAREFSTNLTQTHTQFYTNGFAPIEQYDKRAKRGAYTDVYALAATLYCLVTGEVPTAAPVRTMMPFAEPKEINSHISNKLNQAIVKGMELKPENRPQSMQEWLVLLGISVAAKNPSPSQTFSKNQNSLTQSGTEWWEQFEIPDDDFNNQSSVTQSGTEWWEQFEIPDDEDNHNYQGYNSNEIYIGNLSYEVTKEDIQAVFCEYGKVIHIQLPIDYVTRRIHGYAYVTMETVAQANAAVSALDGAEWIGRDLRVEIFKPYK